MCAQSSLLWLQIWIQDVTPNVTNSHRIINGFACRQLAVCPSILPMCRRWTPFVNQFIMSKIIVVVHRAATLPRPPAGTVRGINEKQDNESFAAFA